MKKVKVLFVCMGNICRSPMAEGVFKALVAAHGLSEHVEIDSAGTHAYHVGENPDPRAQQIAGRRGVDLSTIRARRVAAKDIELFDYVMAMDRDNFSNLIAIAPEGHANKVRLFLEYAQGLSEREVPDPYYGGLAGFDRVLDLIEAASAGLLEEIRTRHF
ncbi:MAG: low molecular weight protein-tyrosine-phosphatase [Pseudomonadota bacterium]